jgi:hypothetical protein
MKYQIIGGILLIAIGYGAGRYVQPAKVVTKVQTVTVTNDVVHDHIVTVTHTVVQPNGEKDTTTTTSNESIIDDQTSTKTNSSTVTTYNKPQWKVQGLAGLSLNSLSTPIYGIGVERRILGPVFVGAYGKSNSEAGLSLSLEF